MKPLSTTRRFKIITVALALMALGLFIMATAAYADRNIGSGNDWAFENREVK